MVNDLYESPNDEVDVYTGYGKGLQNITGDEGRHRRHIHGARRGWPQFKFGPHLTGYNPYEKVLSPRNVHALALKWTSSVVSGNTGAAISKGVVYAGGGNKLYAFPANGCGQVTCAPGLCNAGRIGHHHVAFTP